MRNPPQAKAVASGRCTFNWASSSGAVKLRSTTVPSAGSAVKRTRSSASSSRPRGPLSHVSCPWAPVISHPLLGRRTLASRSCTAACTRVPAGTVLPLICTLAVPVAFTVLGSGSQADGRFWASAAKSKSSAAAVHRQSFGVNTPVRRSTHSSQRNSPFCSSVRSPSCTSRTEPLTAQSARSGVGLGRGRRIFQASWARNRSSRMLPFKVRVSTRLSNAWAGCSTRNRTFSMRTPAKSTRGLGPSDSFQNW